MGGKNLQIVTAELQAAAAQWAALSTQLTSVPPSPGHPFQPTAAAVGAIHAAVGAASASFVARTQATATAMTAAAGGYTEEEAAAASEMAIPVPQIRMV
ncbi:hypothetical protein [Mycobacterium sp. 050134]|uniref:hypothetical protein n=1 Tax=Mycobacterium sp. 050134 TaxID=3096111 RepID=UPI003FA5F1D8